MIHVFKIQADLLLYLSDHTEEHNQKVSLCVCVCSISLCLCSERVWMWNRVLSLYNFKDKHQVSYPPLAPEHTKCSVLRWFANGTEASTAASGASAWNNNRAVSDAKPLRVTQEHSRLAQQSSMSHGPGIIYWVASFGFQYYSLSTNRILVITTHHTFLCSYADCSKSVSWFHDKFISSFVCIRESGFLYSVLAPSQPPIHPCFLTLRDFFTPLFNIVFSKYQNL